MARPEEIVEAHRGKRFLGQVPSSLQLYYHEYQDIPWYGPKCRTHTEPEDLIDGTPLPRLGTIAVKDDLVVSKQRVADHGEVFTSEREVNAMLDLVKQETERIESRFLEPACGTGNFLVEVLRRKLRVVENRYGKVQLEYERNAVLAISSIYGIDILEDNVVQCRERLFGVFDFDYSRLFKSKAKDTCRKSMLYILRKNIVHGDALTLKTVGDNPEPIVFSEWSPVNGSMLKRRDFSFSSLIPRFLPPPELFPTPDLFSDLGEEVFIPKPLREFPLIHFLKVADAE